MADQDPTAEELNEAQTEIGLEIAHYLAWVSRRYGAGTAAESAAKLREQLATPA
jgi:hypothetical protein